jgi:hypothetical protein
MPITPNISQTVKQTMNAHVVRDLDGSAVRHGTPRGHLHLGLFEQTGASSIDQHRDLAMREDLDCLAAEDNGRDAAAAVRRHDD